MRILQVTPWFPPHKGGIANYVSNLCAKVAKLGYDVYVLSAKKLKEDVTFCDIDNSGLINIERMNCLYLPGWPYPTLKSVSIPFDAGFKINSFIKKGKFDIVHVHGLHYPISWLAIYFARKHAIPSVLSLHGTYALNPNILSGETKLEGWLYRYFFSKIISQAGAVIGPTENVTALAQRHQKQNSTIFHTIGYGIDTRRFSNNLNKKPEYRKKYNISEGSTVILFSGRFEKVKGILEFTKAAKRLVDESHGLTEAIIIGSGTLETQVHSIVGNSVGLRSYGWQAEEKVHEFYIASDIYVIPSRFEGLPITILEAMNAGLHIVYAPVGGIPDVLKDYPHKTILTEISERQVYRTLKHLVLAGPRNHAVTVRYAQVFDWDNVSTRINKVYKELIHPVARESKKKLMKQ